MSLRDLGSRIAVDSIARDADRWSSSSQGHTPNATISQVATFCALPMSAPVLVSVVIPAYNYAKFLPAAVESVLAQTYSPIELIVVDDGSTDETPAILTGYGDRIQNIRKVNAGLSAARNTGIKAARGQFVGFLDADDLWLPDKIAMQMELYARHPEAGCIGCGVQVVDADLKEGRRTSHADLVGTSEKRLQDILLRREWVGGSGSGALIRRSILDEVGLFDENLTAAEDWDMWLRIVAQYSVYNVREPLVRIRRHFTGTFRNAEKMERNQLTVYRKQMERTPWAFESSVRRQAMSMIWMDSARERVHARSYWSAAGRLVRALRACPFDAGAWRLLAVCLVRSALPKSSPMNSA